MNVLFVTGIFPPDLGGPATYVPAMASALQHRGHRIVAVVTLAERGAESGSPWPYPVVRLPRRQWRPVRMVRTIATITRLARDADVIYLNGLVLEGIVASRLAGRPSVVKVVGDLIWEKARNAAATTLTIDAFQSAALPWRWRMLRRLQALYTGAATRVLTPSHYLGRIVQGWGVPAGRIDVVHNAVEVPAPAPNVKPEFDLVTVARLVPWKGLAELVDLAKARGWRLKIVGDGPLRRELEERAGGAVVFAGQVPQACVADEIRSGRVFVLNSSYEGLPHIVLEAKAAGVPVIATAVGGTPETITHGVDGVLIPHGDPAALEQAVGALLADETACRRLAAQGAGQVAQLFSFDHMVAETEAVLARAAGVACP
ncbi:MAG: glycosyltransferase family 4 protein [Magnetospirillum sp.]|nr:glycosyltransferase family 4 protein [Magnetospirillum sp.]